MLNYLDLADLETKIIADSNEIITKGVSIRINENMNINEITLISKEAVKNLLADLNPDKVYNFAFDLMAEQLSEEVFETVVNVLVAAFFQGMRIDKGRPRERRLDVPDNLKGDVHCSLALLKNAINYRTLVDRFQLEITGRGLIYILVGGYDE